MNTSAGLQLLDSVLNRQVQITKQNSHSTVIWNPWAEGAQALSDLGQDEWQQMACVEASNILDNAIELAPLEGHTITVTMAVNPL
jgi:glucose-6-phosphate 1-epimerase